MQGDVIFDLATVRRRAGRVRDAAKALEMAAGLYERKGDIVSAAGARAALAQS